MDSTRKQALLAASLAGLVAAVGISIMGQNAGAADEASAEEIPCYGINKCQGTGDCGGKGHGCAGKNGCKGQGYIELSKDTCLKIEGGRLTEDAQS